LTCDVLVALIVRGFVCLELTFDILLLTVQECLIQQEHLVYAPHPREVDSHEAQHAADRDDDAQVALERPWLGHILLLGHPYRIEDTVEHHIKKCENDHLGRAGAEGHLLPVGPHVVDRHGVQNNQESHQRVWDPKPVIE